MTSKTAKEVRQKAKAIKFMRDAEVPGSLRETKGRWYWYVTPPGGKRQSVPLRGVAGKAPTDVLVAANLAVRQWEQIGQGGLAPDFDGTLGSAYDLWSDSTDRRIAYKKEVLRKKEKSFRKCLKETIEPYLDMQIRDFSSGVLKEIIVSWRNRYVWDKVNYRLCLIKQMFNYALDNNLVPADVAYAVSMVKPLKKYGEGARINPLKEPADIASVEIVLKYMSAIIPDMVRVQLEVGGRPGEIIVMRPKEIDRTVNPWIYRPKWHKNLWRGQLRNIAINAKAQAVLEPYLEVTRNTDFLFSPKKAVELNRAKRTEARVFKIEQGNSVGTNRKSDPKVVPGDYYLPSSYAHAVKLACDAAEAAGETFKRFTPVQLRHAFGTEVTRLYGLEVAKNALGHKDTQVTVRYAHKAIDAKSLEDAIMVAKSND